LNPSPAQCSLWRPSRPLDRRAMDRSADLGCRDDLESRRTAYRCLREVVVRRRPALIARDVPARPAVVAAIAVRPRRPLSRNSGMSRQRIPSAPTAPGARPGHCAGTVPTSPHLTATGGGRCWERWKRRSAPGRIGWSARPPR